MKEQSEFHAERAYHSLDKRLSLMEQTLTVIRENHLAHIENDLRWVKTVMWVTAVGVIGNLLSIIYMLVGS
jgi:hypothetical protein